MKALLVLTEGLLLIFSMTRTTILRDLEEHNIFAADKLWTHLLVLAAVAAAVFLAGWFLPKSSYHRWENGLTIVMLTAAFFMALYWVCNTRFEAMGDSAVIWSIAEQMDQGDFSAFRDLNYGERYFNQTGTIMFHYFLIHVLGIKDIFIIQLLNVPMLILLYTSLWKLSQELFGRRAGNLTAILTLLFLPPGLYVVFAYNNMFSWSLGMFAVWQEALYLKMGRKRNGALLLVSAAAAVQFKMFSWIVLAAMVVYGAYEGIRRKRRSILLYLTGSVGLILLLSLLFGKFIDSHLDGYQRKGLSPLGHVSMGMQEGPMAPGWYNGIHDATYLETQGDRQAMDAVFIRLIKDHTLNFIRHPGYAIRFYSLKIASAWNNPSFQGFWFGEISAPRTAVPQWVRSVYSGKLRRFLDHYLNYLLTVIHAGALSWLLIGWRRLGMEELLPGICFQGGFLFLLIWETKCQYTLGFFIFLLPYCICGYRELYRRGASVATRVCI